MPRITVGELLVIGIGKEGRSLEAELSVEALDLEMHAAEIAQPLGAAPDRLHQPVRMVEPDRPDDARIFLFTGSAYAPQANS